MRINQIQFVNNFKLEEDLLLSHGPILQKMKNSLNGKLIILNVPKSAPPPAPRALIQLKNCIINVALDKIDITIKPPPHVVHDYRSSGNFAHSIIESIISIFYEAQLQYEWSGIIATIEYPIGPQTLTAVKAVTRIYDKLINVPRHNLDLVSFQLQFGFSENNFYKNYSIGGYESRNVDLKDYALSPERRTVVINLEEFPIVESGLQISLDINNRPTPKKTLLEDLSDLFSEHYATFDGLGKKLNLEEFLK